MWLPEDRDAALVWLEESRHRCPSCGTSQWEWDENGDAWHADHITCEGCRRLAAHRKRIMDSPSADNHAGFQSRLYRTPREED